MVFSEYAREKFCGDEERALMHMAKDMALFIAEKDFPDKDFVWSPEWFNIAKSFTEEQREAYSRYLEIYEQEHKILLTKEKVLLKTKDFPKKRNVLLALSILVTVFFCFWVFPLAVVMLIVDIPLYVWAIKGNKIYKALRHNDYYIIEAACSYKHHETKIDDEGSEVNYYRLYFRGFDAYDGTESDFENIKSDEECFLVIVNGTTKVQQFYQAKYYELSNDFRFDGDKYIPIV